MDDHSRTIIHIDIDCFYAQVEMIKQPNLKEQPLGIQQKSIVVTSNYVARKYGIQKCMSISEAKSLCPNLVLVNGEDLYEYRHVSSKVSELLQGYSELVERLGLDENFVDVTELVNKRIMEKIKNYSSVGCLFGDQSGLMCDCGCMEKISMGSQIAQEMRAGIFEKLQLTTCAGIAHNKLLAKIVGSTNKPNNQTLLFPNSAIELMLSLEDVENIPWVGQVTSKLLSQMNINKVKELQNCDLLILSSIFDKDKVKTLTDLSLGIDNTPVKKSGKPQSIGLEDACKSLTTEGAVEDKLRELLTRLLILVKEDGRIPKVMKLTVRKFNQSGGVRESRQCNINIPLNNQAHLMSVGMGLFKRAVDTKGMFKINLLGVAFSKFVDKPNEKSTLTHFLTSNHSFVETVGEFKQPEATDEATASLIIECPPGVDKSVFRELPPDVQQELLDDFKAKREKDQRIQRRQSDSKKRKANNTLFNYMERLPKR